MEYNETRGGWLVSIGQYIAWLITSLGAIMDALYIREAVLYILSLYQVIQTEAFHKRGGIGLNLQYGFAMSAVDDFLLLILGCGAVVAAVTIEYYFRKGRPKGLLLKRIGVVVGVEIGIIAAMILLQMLI